MLKRHWFVSQKVYIQFRNSRKQILFFLVFRFIDIRNERLCPYWLFFFPFLEENRIKLDLQTLSNKAVIKMIHSAAPINSWLEIIYVNSVIYHGICNSSHISLMPRLVGLLWLKSLIYWNEFNLEKSLLNTTESLFNFVFIPSNFECTYFGFLI